VSTSPEIKPAHTFPPNNPEQHQSRPITADRARQKSGAISAAASRGFVVIDLVSDHHLFAALDGLKGELHAERRRSERR